MTAGPMTTGVNGGSGPHTVVNPGTADAPGQEMGAETVTRHRSPSVDYQNLTGGMPLRQALEQARKKGYEGDACPDCQQFTLVRNGACLKCGLVRSHDGAARSQGRRIRGLRLSTVGGL